MDQQRNILVVDDSSAIVMMVSSMLSDLGQTSIDGYLSAKQALEQLGKTPGCYDIVFTDLNMPDMDGMGFIRELSRIGFSGGVCIISDMDTRVIELAADVARQQHICLLGSICKPISTSSLKLVLDRMRQFEERRFVNYTKMSRDDLIGHITHHQVVPYYQPKLNPHNNRVESLEVLARIQKPGETDAILPGRFLPTANEHDLVDLLTMQLAEKTATHMAHLSQIFGDGVKVSINLSAQQLADLGLADRLDNLFECRNIDKSRVILEITEDYALKSPEQLESLNRLRIKGYGVSLDDFGTGFTNLHQLRSMPFTEVKIDRTLVSQIQTDGFSQVIVQSLTELTEKFDVDLVAEGIETIEELEYFTSRYPKIYLQGFLICKPKPIESLATWYNSWLKGTGKRIHSAVQ